DPRQGRPTLYRGQSGFLAAVPDRGRPHLRVTGTLNMADLANRLTQVAPEDLGLLRAGFAILGVAFLVKAGMWPLCFWLPTTYAAASAPAAALFSIMSKVGVYAILRLGLLLFGDGSDA